MFPLPLQLQQLINLTLLLLLGFSVSSVYLSFYSIASIIIVILFWEYLFISIVYKKEYFFPYSAVSTVLGVVLMMASSSIWIYYVMAIGALLQKHLLRIGNRHIFNPSNFALIFGLLLFYNRAHIVLGQLGDEVWFGCLLVMLGFAILYRAKRWMIPLAFTALYLLLQYYIVVLHDPVMIPETVYYRFYSVSFLLFIFFMLTDPLTTPDSIYGQVWFAFFVAFGATMLDYYYGFRVQHLFLSLFIVTPLSRFFESWKVLTKKERLLVFPIVLLALSAIIVIEMQPPYHFEMEG